MTNVKNEMFELMSKYISKSDIYAADAIAKVSAFIYKYRYEKNMSQKTFAEMMGVTQGMVSKWESASYNFTIETISQICEKLDVTFNITFVPENDYLTNDSKNRYDDVDKINYTGSTDLYILNAA